MDTEPGTLLTHICVRSLNSMPSPYVANNKNQLSVLADCTVTRCAASTYLRTCLSNT